MKLLPPKRIFTRLMISYLLVTLAVLGVIAIIFINLMQKYFFSIEGFQLESQGEKAASLLGKPLLENDLTALTRLADTIAFSYDVYLWVIDAGGSILTVAGGNPQKLGLQVEETEIAHVLAGNYITKQITGPDYNSLIHMTPVYENLSDGYGGGITGGEQDKEQGPVIGALAISHPLWPVTVTIARLKRLVFYAAGGATVLALFLGYSLSRKIAQPLEDMSRVALAVSRGDYQNRISYSSDDELGQLAGTLNFAIEQFGATIEQQHRLVRLQQEFISDISHEFRAPLTSLQGFLELLKDGKCTAEETRSYLEIMHKDTVSLGRLVQDLLDLTNLESHGITLEKSRCDPEQLMRLSLKHLHYAAAQKDITLSFKVVRDVPDIDADEIRLHQVLVNLVENAIRCSPHGSEISLTLEREDEGVTLKVADQGSGIPTAELPLIWNRFYKVNKARTRFDTGTGLGLAIVKRIIELHGGRVSAQSEPGHGAVFSIWLPQRAEVRGWKLEV